MAVESDLRTLCILIVSVPTISRHAELFREQWPTARSFASAAFSEHHRKSVSERWWMAKGNRESRIGFPCYCFPTSAPVHYRSKPGYRRVGETPPDKPQRPPRQDRTVALITVPGFCGKKKHALLSQKDGSSAVFTVLYLTSPGQRRVRDPNEGLARVHSCGAENEWGYHATNHKHPWPQCIHFSWSHSRLRLALRPRSSDFQESASKARRTRCPITRSKASSALSFAIANARGFVCPFFISFLSVICARRIQVLLKIFTLTSDEHLCDRYSFNRDFLRSL